MRKLFKSLIVLNSLLLSIISFAQDPSQTHEKAIIDWIKENAVPINQVEAGNGFDDLQPLKEILKDVKLVGLGEATHGTREFFQIKLRLLEFLVTEMGFTGFAMEAPYYACQPINDYILSGKGDLSTVLTGQGYVVWDTEEMADVIEWMRTYNQHVPEEKKVKFYGVDLAYQEIGRREFINYLEKVAPEKQSHTDSVFQTMAEQEMKWPMQKDDTFDQTMLQTLPLIQTLTRYLTVNKEMLVQKSSLAEFDQALQVLKLMRQFILANTPGLHPPFVDGVIVRSYAMAENLIYLLDQAGPNAKFVFWASNNHISKDVFNYTEDWKRSTYMGYQLMKKYGKEYYALAMEVNQGSYQTRTFLPPNLLGDLKSITIPPAPVGSWPWYLSRANVENFLIDFRGASFPSEVETWAYVPREIFRAGWVYNPKETYLELKVGKLYDGILYIHTTNPTRPTANALKSAAERRGL